MKSLLNWSFVIVLLASCGSETTSTSSTNGTDNQTPTTSTPQGNSGDVSEYQEPVVDTGVTYYPDEDPVEPEVQLPGSEVSTCGVAYVEMNVDGVSFSHGGTTYHLNSYGTNTQAYLHQIVFTSDLSRSAYQLCFDGYVNGSEMFLDSVSSFTATQNPSITTQGYSTMLCGYTAFQRSSSGDTYLTLKVDQISYIVETNVATNDIPNVGNSAVTASNGLEACFYSNRSIYRDYSRNFKPFFPVDYIDLGE